MSNSSGQMVNFPLPMSPDSQTRTNSKTRSWCTSFSWGLLRLGFLVALASMSCAQTESPASGVVTTGSGQPVAGAVVWAYGALPRDEITTDAGGRFRLERPERVIHIMADNFEPKTLVLGPGTPADLRVILDAVTDRLMVPTCGKLPPSQKAVSWGSYGLQYRVPQRGVKISGGETDVDYTVYTIGPKGSKTWLELWFGPYAMGSEPDDQQFLKSVDFGQRVVVSGAGEFIGVDSWGQLPDRKSWRHTFVSGEGARYLSAFPQDAKLLDDIVNSLCLVPYPNR